MFINNKKIHFPYNEKIEVNYNKEETKTKKYKIIDKNHTDYYKIKLCKNELEKFILKNKLQPIFNYIKETNKETKILTKNYWKLLEIIIDQKIK